MTSSDVRARVLTLLANVDADLTRKVAAYLGMSAPAGKPNLSVKASPALSMAATPSSAATKKVAILVADGVKASDVTAAQDALKAAGAMWTVVGTHLGPQIGADGVVATETFDTTMSVLYDAAYVPGGGASLRTLEANGKAVRFIEETFVHFKPIVTAGEGNRLVRRAVPSGRNPGVIFGDNGGQVSPSLLKALVTARFWDRQNTATVS